jgi:hypothetical protein
MFNWLFSGRGWLSLSTTCGDFAVRARLLLFFTALVFVLNMPAFADALATGPNAGNDFHAWHDIGVGSTSNLPPAPGPYSASDFGGESHVPDAYLAETAPTGADSGNDLGAGGVDPTSVASRRRWGIRLCLASLFLMAFGSIGQRR